MGEKFPFRCVEQQQFKLGLVDLVENDIKNIFYTR